MGHAYVIFVYIYEVNKVGDNVIIFCKNMTEQPTCSENELRCRWRHRTDCTAAADPWNSSIENISEYADEDRLHEESCLADVQHLQEVEPLASADKSDRQTSASHNGQLVRFCFNQFLFCLMKCRNTHLVLLSKRCF